MTNLEAHFKRWKDWTRKAAREVGCSVTAFNEVSRAYSRDGSAWNAVATYPLRRTYYMLLRNGLVEVGCFSESLFGSHFAEAELTPKGRQVVWMRASVFAERMESYRSAVLADRGAA